MFVIFFTNEMLALLRSRHEKAARAKAWAARSFSGA